MKSLSRKVPLSSCWRKCLVWRDGKRSSNQRGEYWGPFVERHQSLDLPLWLIIKNNGNSLLK